MKKVVIVGGGIMGLMSAYYLSKHQLDITIIDQGNLESNGSTGNAGMIVPSHFTPLAAPGIVFKGFKWMFNPESPFRFYPSFNKELLGWGWRFYRHANKKHVQKSQQALLNLNLFSKKLYQDLYAEKDFLFDLKEDGILMLSKTDSNLKEEIKLAEKAAKLGLDVKVLNAPEINKMEATKVDVAGGVWYKNDAHLSPEIFIQNLINFLKKTGVKFELNQSVLGFHLSQKRIKQIRFGEMEIEADEFVLAAGIFSSTLAKQLNLKLPMQGGKGYSVTFKNQNPKPKYPALLMEARVAVTPMGKNLRVGGTMEIGSDLRSINRKKVEGILKAMPNYYPDLSFKYPDVSRIWSALRPLSPDGLPYIGRSEDFENLTMATGHAMMGLSLGPATGKLVEETILNENLSQELNLFNPNRFH